MYRLSHATFGAAAAPGTARVGWAERGGNGGTDGEPKVGGEGGEGGEEGGISGEPPPGERSQLVAQVATPGGGGTQRQGAGWRAPLRELRRRHLS